MIADLVKGKRVVFVGPSPILQGLGRGSVIDNFDVVVKTNNLPGMKGFDEDYGQRCDIIYMNHQYNNEMKHLPFTLWKRRGMKVVCAKSNPHNRNANTAKFFHVRDLPYDKLAAHIKEAKAQTMGLILMIDLLTMKPESIDVMGIDCYSGQRNSYIDGYIPKTVASYAKKNGIEFQNPPDTHPRRLHCPFRQAMAWFDLDATDERVNIHDI